MLLQYWHLRSVRKVKVLAVILGLTVFLYIGFLKDFTFNFKVRHQNSPKPDVWSEPCPVWSPGDVKAGPSSRAVLANSTVSAATLSTLTSMLKERLDKVKDVVIPDYSRPCNTSAPTFSACTSPNCNDRISTNLGERVKDVLMSPELQLTSEHRAAIKAFGELFPSNEVIIVTATSSDHFGETQKLFKSLHEIVYQKLRNFSAVIVDIGLTAHEVKLAERGCRCKVIKFPYYLFPEHVEINNCYSFKPLSVLAAMQRANKMVIWQDSSVRWTDGFFHIFERTEKIGTQIIRYEDGARVITHTLRQPFDYMKRELCAFTTFPEIEACAQFHRKDPVSLRLILEPWARCGLERCCICPVAPWPVLPCVKQVFKHRCHRFDQSALTFGMARLLDTEFQKFVMPNSFEKKPILYKLGGDQLNDYF